MAGHFHRHDEQLDFGVESAGEWWGGMRSQATHLVKRQPQRSPRHVAVPKGETEGGASSSGDRVIQWDTEPQQTWPRVLTGGVLTKGAEVT